MGTISKDLKDGLVKIFDEAEQEGSCHEFPISLLKGTSKADSEEQPKKTGEPVVVLR